MSNEIKKPLTQLMAERGFKLADVCETEKSKYCFRFIGDNIIVEVIANGIYKFIYTNINMFGFVDTGYISHINDDEYFNKNLLRFHQTIKPLMENNLYE